MSNQVVGNVYQQIIDKVVTVSSNDFEEFGVDPSTLKELQQGWQDKLSALKVAQFPWEPQPEPVRQPPTVPSNVKADTEIPASGTQESLNFPNVPIKVDSSYTPPITNYPSQQQTADGTGYNGGYAQTTQLAQQRAAALVQQRVLQQGHPQPQQNYAQQQHLPQIPMQGQQQHMMTPQQQQQQHHQPHQHQHHQAQQQRSQQMQVPPQQRPQQDHIYTSQTDGSGDALADWEAMKAARAASIEEKIAADQSMRARIDAMGMRQDSGLMVPLKSIPKGKKHKAAVRVLQSEDAEALSRAFPPGRFDGDDDVKPEEDPDDAINSDLDDPEDDLNDGDNSDDDMVDYMLCTYDKVQRVKNKWKCTLKDGILTTNKKEYLFHKANAELEF